MAVKDISGQKFGFLTVTEFAEIRNHKAYWKCKCECGSEKVIASRPLISGATISCGCKRGKIRGSQLRKDITNQRFGMLVAVYDTGRRNSFGNVYWHCKCDCGNEVDILTASLISGNTKSCGCYAKKLVHQNQFKDLTNQKFGKLTVKGIHHKKGKIYYWECMCDCGKTTIVDGGSLRRGHTKSCGCYRPRLDITGERYGHLVAQKYIGKTNQGISIWQFKCDCGNIKDLRISDVRFGKIQSCGCLNVAYCGSKDENQIKSFIESIVNIKAEKARILDGKEIDIYFPSLHIGVEYNGSVYHASKGGVYKDLTANYHRDKFLQAKEQGIHLINIFDVDWTNNQERIKMYLKSLFLKKKRLFAKQCIVKAVSKETAKSFCNKYHLQGSSIFSSINYGLYYDDELISVMCFGKLRLAKTDMGNYELHRYCVKEGLTVVGGAERLLSHFIKDYQPKYVRSYSDNDYFSGDIYNQLGFDNEGQCTPRYYWYYQGMELKREKCQLRCLKKLYPDLYEESLQDNGSKEDYIMLKLGAKKVYRSGCTKWIFRQSDR